MTISNPAASVTLQGNGATTSWPYSFLIPDGASITVSITDNTQPYPLVTVLTSGQYGVSGLGNPSGGSVTYPTSGAPLASGWALTIERTMAATQSTSLAAQGAVYPAVLEAALDRVTMLSQQLAAKLARALLVPVGSTINPTSYVGTVLSQMASALSSAAGAAGAAAGSASAAAGSAGAAAGSASVAAIQAGIATSQVSSCTTLAAQALSNAQLSQLAMTTAQFGALTATTQAAMALTSSGLALVAASTAQGSAITASQQAAIATTAAGTAQGSAVTANQQAAIAITAASTAQGSAVTAGQYATSALQALTSAQVSALSATAALVTCQASAVTAGQYATSALQALTSAQASALSATAALVTCQASAVTAGQYATSALQTLTSAQASALSAAIAAGIATAAINNFTGASSTNLTIGTGDISLIVNTNKGFAISQPVQIIDQSNANNYMYGLITGYTAATGAITASITSTGGSGTKSAWYVNLVGIQGLTGSAGSLAYGMSTGTVDALTASISGPTTSDGTTVLIGIFGANLTTGPTFKLNGDSVKTISKLGGNMVAKGDLQDNSTAILAYRSTLDKWDLQNPKVPLGMSPIVSAIIFGG